MGKKGRKKTIIVFSEPFFGRQKQRIARMTEKSTYYDDDGLNYKYDGDDDNIDEIGEKK